MKVILFGATGMVGQGVLRECLLDPAVERVLVVGRSATGRTDPKLRERVVADLFDVSAFGSDLAGYDACFFCLGVSAAGMTEAAYHHLTYDLTTSIGEALAARSPNLTFIYVSGTGTDSTEHGRAMWARVKGKTENALLRLPFKAAYMFRPGLIQPMHGAVSKTRVYRISYAVLGWLIPLLRRLFPGAITTTENVGRAMLRVAKAGATKRLLENRDIEALAHPTAGSQVSAN